ncbi:MAG: hypothetical protein K6G84_04240 [Lachnospiraceae bacterium]|nr:hypothetical protein [Lachnospiraceae bacterium]
MNSSYVSWAKFRRVCKLVCNLHTNEISYLEKLAKKQIENQYEGKTHLDGELAYEIISSNSIAKRIMDKNGYDNWEKVMRKFISCEVDEKMRQDEYLIAFKEAWNGFRESKEEISE